MNDIFTFLLLMMSPFVLIIFALSVMLRMIAKLHKEDRERKNAETKTKRKKS